jgi:hypothetical protein
VPTSLVIQYPSSIPNPNRAKSYLTGSEGSSRRRLLVSSRAVSQSVCLRVISPSCGLRGLHAHRRGKPAVKGLFCAISQNLRPLVSLRTIHRRNILRRLQAELAAGVDICLRVRAGAYSRLKNKFRKPIKAFSMVSVTGLHKLNKAFFQRGISAIISPGKRQ